MSRNITIKINWILENLLFPVLRESKVLMYWIIWFAYGKYTRYVMEFKDRYPDLTDEEIGKYYELIKDAPINKKRKTDINQQCIEFIEKEIRKEDKVLDAACGRGYMVDRLHSKGVDIYGIDIVLNKQQEKIGYYKEGDLKNIPYEDNSFDIVICTHALEHIREYKVAIEELKRVSKDKIIIIMPKQREYRYTPDLHVNFCPYLYRFKEFVYQGGLDGAQCFEMGGDFVCVYSILKRGGQ